MMKRAAVTMAGLLLGAEAVAHEPFFERLRSLCGQTLTGSTVVERGPDDVFTGAALVVGPVACAEGEVRMPLAVDADRSRTWIVRYDGSTLTLKHDHRHPDGTPHEVTDYGGIAVASDDPERRVFPSDPYTLANLPRTQYADWVLVIGTRPAVLRYELRVSEGILVAVEFPLTRF